MMDTDTELDRKRRKAITDWWERQTLREFIARVRESRALSPHPEGERE